MWPFKLKLLSRTFLCSCGMLFKKVLTLITQFVERYWATLSFDWCNTACKRWCQRVWLKRNLKGWSDLRLLRCNSHFSVFFNVPQMKIIYIIFLSAKPNQLVITETYLRTTRELAKHENPTTPPWLKALFAEAWISCGRWVEPLWSIKGSWREPVQIVFALLPWQEWQQTE